MAGENSPFVQQRILGPKGIYRQLSHLNAAGIDREYPFVA